MPAVLAFRQDAYSADTRLTITVSTDPEGTDLVPVTFEPITDWSALMSNPTLRQQVVDSLGQTGDPSLVLGGVGLNNVPYGQTLYVRAVAEDSTEVSARSVARGFGTVFSSVGRSYYGKDHLGSVRVTVTGSGEVVQASDYDPFGLELDGRSMAKPDAPVERYTGHELDEETGLYYAGARYLDPVIGRWLAVDPLADKYPAHSPYNYVLNNPLSLNDPDGRAASSACCLNVAGAAAVANGADPVEVMQAHNIGALKGTATGIAVAALGYLATAAPAIAAWVLENPILAIEGAALVAGMTIEGPEDLCPTCRGDELGKVLRNMFPSGGKVAKTVLGRYPNYLEVADELNANRFSIGQHWDEMIEQGLDPWTANQKFLDLAVQRGDEIVLARPFSPDDAGSVLEREIRYLQEVYGYRLSEDGTSLLPPE